MKTIFIVLVLSLGFLAPKTTECAWCPSYKCYGACGVGCQCMTFGGQVGGTCVSIERVPDYERMGWSR